MNQRGIEDVLKLFSSVEIVAFLYRLISTYF